MLTARGGVPWRLTRSFMARSFLTPSFLTLLSLIPSSMTPMSMAGPIHDPFVQDFQVGAFTEPGSLPLEHGLPANLLEQASLDTSWTRAGLVVLGGEPTADSRHMSLRLLSHGENLADTTSWLRWHALRVSQLEGWRDSLDTSGTYLLGDRLSMGFFRALADGNLEEARGLASRLERDHQRLGLPDREGFIWGLRHRLIRARLAGNEGDDPPGAFWSGILDLGTFDTATAWVLWRAHRQGTGQTLLPASLDSQNEAAELAVLRNSGLTAQDLQNSAFPDPIKGALGAKLLKDDDLRNHMARHPQPPENSQLQGWWTYGQRRSRYGVVSHYEKLAQNTALKPGWRLDVWRRASEIHLLAGRWEPGLRDLAESLNVAADGGGSNWQRTRLRQWCEQAYVLALALGKQDRAAEVHALALATFKGEEGMSYREETRHWFPDSTQSFKGDLDRKTAALRLVEAGNVADCASSSAQRRADLVAACADPRWDLWARWGLSLLDTFGSESGAAGYRASLQACLDAGASSDGASSDGASSDVASSSRALPDQEATAVAAVGRLLGTFLPRDRVLRWAVEKDIHHLTGGEALHDRSPLVKLAQGNRNRPIFLHALLGAALLLDDMRAVVSAATPLPKAGLTSDEKLCFLYPLPQDGAVLQALLEANNDPALILAVARNESLFEPSIRSRAGALGFMQIMPFHYPGKGAGPGAENWSHAGVSIRKGDSLLTENRKRYEDNPYLALAAYNAGSGAVQRWQKQLGGPRGNDIFLAWIGYPETRNYVAKVLRDREVYDWIIRDSRITRNNRINRD